MACSSVPSRFQSFSSTSASQFHFARFQPETRSLKSFKGQKLKIYCCQQTIQIDNETQQRENVVKKQRKPRPSFLEQVQSKWSQKNPSLRENFPWEIRENDAVNPEFQPQVTKFSDGVSPEKDEKSFSVSEPASLHSEIKSISPPWEHGKGQRKKPSSSESFKEFDVKVRQQDESVNGLNENCQKEAAFGRIAEGSNDLENKTTVDENPKEKFSKFDVLQIGFPENEASNEVAFVENPSTNCVDGGNKRRATDQNYAMRMPWESRKDKEFVKETPRNSNTVLAERLIPEPELKRLRSVSLRMVERIKVGASGVTQVLVDAIHEKWKDDEVVKLKFEGPAMKRIHEILESRTGGLVIWRSGGLVVLYRGMTYKLDCVRSYTRRIQADAELLGSSPEASSQTISGACLNGAAESSRPYNSKYTKRSSEKEQMDLTELNFLLDQLGPRYTDWSGREPIPVDADSLPAVVPGYKTPFRLLPYGTRPALRDKEMTYLRRTARMVPPHFALGRSRQLQGLATAMVKLWEKSSIAKIAIKRGVLNTNNERMAEELKILTGGTLVSRNKEFIVFYRGNDFLPPGVSTVLIEAEKSVSHRQDEEDRARERAATLINQKSKTSAQPLVAGTLMETVAATSRWGSQLNGMELQKMMRDEAVARHTSLINSLQKKIALAKGKIGRAEKTLQKVLENQEPEDLPTDLETLTDEERFLLRRIGLSMKPYLVLGRREIFDGTIENMHLHWKYRELVKIMVHRKSFSQVKHIAVSLEAESGGVLVSVDKTEKGYVIIVYRGKNYQRPLTFRPKNLLTRRQALARSIELQRREALKHHVVELENRVEELKRELEDMITVDEHEEEEMVDSANAGF